MSTEHAIDPSTLAQQLHDLTCTTRGPWRECPYDGSLAFDLWARFIADECPPAEQWRQVTPEEVREGWLVERRKGETKIRGRVTRRYGPELYDEGTTWLWRPEFATVDDWTLWTTEPADPDAERRRLIEAATGRNAETLEATLAEYGLAIVEVDRGE